MIAYSKFPKCETFKKSGAYEVPVSQDYKVYIDGVEIPVYSSRISAYPMNRSWPGYQRPIEQTEKVSFINLVADEQVTIEVEPLKKKNAQRIMVKPYSKNVSIKNEDGRYVFTLKENGGYVFEIDDYFSMRYEIPKCVQATLKLKNISPIALKTGAHTLNLVLADE